MQLIIPKISARSLLEIEPDLPANVLRVFATSLAPHVVPVFIAAVVAFDDQNSMANNPWIAALQCLLSTAVDSSDLFRQVVTHLLSPLLKARPSACANLLEAVRNSADGVVVAVARVAKSFGLVESCLPDHIHAVATRALHHSNETFRLEALALLLDQNKSSVPITDADLSVVRRHLGYNMTSTSSEFRQKLSNVIHRFLVRLRDHVYLLARPKAAALSETSGRLQIFRTFLGWLIDFLFSSLHPGCSFQRASTALRLLWLVNDSFRDSCGLPRLPHGAESGQEVPAFPFELPLGTRLQTNALMALLMSTFDSVRSGAFDLLVRFPSPPVGFESLEDAVALLHRGLIAASSPRSQTATSGALICRLVFVKYVKTLRWYIYPADIINSRATATACDADSPELFFMNGILDLLRQSLEGAKENLVKASVNSPMHGPFVALQYLTQELQDVLERGSLERVAPWKLLFERLMDCICEVGAVVLAILSTAAPEGHLPPSFRELDENIQDLVDDGCDGLPSEDMEGAPQSQLLVSFCWRALKEASILLQHLLPMLIRIGLLSDGSVARIGNFLIDTLTSIRHWGAVVPLADAVALLCPALLASGSAKTVMLPGLWMREILARLSTNSNISVTRRSAGLPFCIVALLVGQSSAVGPLAPTDILSSVMTELLRVAESPLPDDFDQRNDLPQVHAMNVLRAIYRDARLAKGVFPFIEDGLMVSIRGASSSQFVFVSVRVDGAISLTACFQIAGRSAIARQCCLAR